MASNLKDANNGNGKNSDPAVIAADAYRDRINANRDTIAAGMKNLTGITSGDAGYVAGRAATKELALSMDELIAWNPAARENPLEKALVDAQNDTSEADKSPRVQAAYSEALLAAVCASDKAVADSARIGKGTDAKPQFGAVRKRLYSSPDAVKANTFVGNQADAAKSIAANLASSAKDPTLHAIWKMADAAVNNEAGLRAMGAKLAAISVNVGRWRNYLFMGIAANAIDKYATSDEATTTVGRVWQPVLAAARRAHSSVVAKAISNGEALTSDLLLLGYPNATPPVMGITEAIDKAIEPHRGVKGRKVLEGDEEKKVLREKLFRVLREADELWTGYGLVDLVNFEIKRKDDSILAEDGLFDPKDKAMVERYQRLTGGVIAASDNAKASADAAQSDQDKQKAAAKAKRAGSADVEAAKQAVGKKGNVPQNKIPLSNDAAARLAKLKQSAS